MRSQGKKLTLLANISRQQFHAHDFTLQLANDLTRLGIPLSYMDLEIEENVAMEEGPSAVGRMTALRETGFGVVIGQFGSGHSTFLQLFGRPSTAIRVDAALTRRVQGKGGAEFIEAIVNVAHASKMYTIASGVKDAETAALLTLLGVDRLQGRYFGEPVDSQRFEFDSSKRPFTIGCSAFIAISERS